MDFRSSLEKVLAEIAAVLSDIDEDTVDSFTGEILKAKRVFTLGMGRSGLAMKAFAMRLMHLGLRVHVIGETTTPAVEEGDVLIVGTASGETASVVANCRKAFDCGTTILAITASGESTVSSMSSGMIMIPTKTPKVPERKGVTSIQPMGNLFEQSLLIVTDIIVMNIMEKLDMSSKEMFRNHANLE